MQQMTCTKQRATDNIQQKACNRQHALDNRRHAADNVQQTTCNVQHVQHADKMQQTTDTMQQTTCHLEPICCMQHATDSACHRQIEERARAIEQCGNTAVYYKAIAETYMWGCEYLEAMRLYCDAVALLKVETRVDCSKMIEDAMTYIGFCRRCLDGEQESPQSLQVAGSGSGGGG